MRIGECGASFRKSINVRGESVGVTSHVSDQIVLVIYSDEQDVGFFSSQSVVAGPAEQGKKKDELNSHVEDIARRFVVWQ